MRDAAVCWVEAARRWLPLRMECLPNGGGMELLEIRHISAKIWEEHLEKALNNIWIFVNH